MIKDDPIPLLMDEIGTFFLLMVVWDIVRSIGIAFLTKHIMKK